MKTLARISVLAVAVALLFVAGLRVARPKVHAQADSTVLWAEADYCSSSCTLTWSGGGFADTNYTTVCSAAQYASGSLPTLLVGVPVSTTTINVGIYPQDAIAHINCIGVHH